MAQLALGAIALAAFFGFLQVVLAVWAVVVASISRRNVRFFDRNGYLMPNTRRSGATMVLILFLTLVNPVTWLVVPYAWDELPSFFQTVFILSAGAIIISAAVCLGEYRLPRRSKSNSNQTLGPSTTALFEASGTADSPN